jgi:alpha-beta hydrolase superfamily lysophospholipase
MSVVASNVATDIFTVSDGYPLRYRRFEPDKELRGTVVGVHGIQSHGGWYEYSCRKLSEAGYRVIYPDRRGSGLNQQARGDTPSFGRLLDDLTEIVRSDVVRTRADTCSVPVFLMAVSWGGKLAVALQRRQSNLVDGLIVLCPGIFPQVGLPISQRLGILGVRVLTPHRLFPIPLNDPELFTASPRWREYIRTDPLALRQATARFLVESVRLDRYLRAAPSDVKVPTLLLLAGKDRIIRNDKTHRFFQRFAAADKNAITYAQAHHTLEFEPDPDRFIGEMVRWLGRIPRTVP